jgi:hypothetical protein
VYFVFKAFYKVIGDVYLKNESAELFFYRR